MGQRPRLSEGGFWLALATKKYTQYENCKGYKELGKKKINFPICHFVWGHYVRPLERCEVSEQVCMPIFMVGFFEVYDKLRGRGDVLFKVLHIFHRGVTSKKNMMFHTSPS